MGGKDRAERKKKKRLPTALVQWDKRLFWTSE